MATIAALRASTSDGSLPAYAWPGGYPLEYVTEDGLMICPACANVSGSHDGFVPSDPVIAGDVFWEGEDYPCEDCGKPISSAYGPLVDTGDED